MKFELGKQYIVKVTENGIIPEEEFRRERFFDKDNDSLEFLTDEEKTVIINTVLDKIRAEIEQVADKQFQIAMGVEDLNERYTHIRMESAYRHSLNIIDKYKAESEKV